MTCAHRSLEHWTRDCEKGGSEKSAMLAKINAPENSEMGLVAVTIGAAHRDGKEEWDSDSGASLRVITYVPYPSRNDCLQEDACGDDW